MNPENTSGPADDANACETLGPVDLDAVKERTRAIVAKGEDVRGRIAGLVADAARRAQESGQGVLSLVKSVVEGAAGAASEVVHEKPDGTLRQVTEALGDGLSQAALSAKLAMEEARARGQKFTAEDLKRVGDNFEAIRSTFTQTVAEGGKAVQSFLSDQVGDLTEHAERVLSRIKPSVEAAVQAAREHPVELGKESLAAGGAAARGAAGSLFTAMGKMLQQAGEALNKERGD
ncbi:MAG: DUF6781 family protein [Isosphaeraceae bacterium]